MAEKRVIELEIKTDSVKSLKAQLREAQADVAALSEKFGATSKEAINAAKRAAQLKDAIGDAKALTDAYNPDAKFNALSASIGGVLNGFQAFQGALGLVGVEGKAVEEALLKVNSAMALTQGINGLLEAREDFGRLATKIKNLTIVQKLSTAAQWLWNAAMSANPLGAIVLAITAVIVAGYKLIQFFQDSAAENRKHEESIKKRTAALKKEEAQMEASSKRQKDYNSYQYEYAKAAGASSEQLRKLALKHQEEELALANKNKELARSTYLRQQDILASMIANDADEERIEKQKELVKAARENATKTREIAVQEKQDLIALKRAQIVEIRQEETDAANKAKETRKENTQKAVSDAKEQAEKLKAERERLQKEADQAAAKANEDRISKEDAQYALELSLMKDSKAKEKQELTNSYDEKFAIADGNAELEKQLKEQLRTELAAIDKSYSDAELAKIEEANQKKLASDKGFLEARITQNENDFQAKLELLELNKQAELSNKELTEGEKAAIEAKYAKQRDELENQSKEKTKQSQQKKVDLAMKYAQTFTNVMGSLTGALNAQDQERLKNVKKGSAEELAIKKRMFERDKKMRIAQTIIDTASNVIQSVRNGGGVPTGIPFGIAAGVQGAIQLAAIAKTKFEGAGGGVGEQAPPPVTSTSGGAVAPNFNIVGNAQAQNPLSALGQQPIKAYVVSGEVTTAQSLDRQKVYSATFG